MIVYYYNYKRLSIVDGREKIISGNVVATNYLQALYFIKEFKNITLENLIDFNYGHCSILRPCSQLLATLKNCSPSIRSHVCNYTCQLSLNYANIPRDYTKIKFI